jgi:cyclopropane fatty-acyl-phospholipid synthase-like methyltransferase
MIQADYYDENYFERGAEVGKSLYSHYRWMPELTIPMCHHIVQYCNIKDEKVLDFGCAKGYSVYALRLLGIDAYGVDMSEYAIQESPKEVEKYVRIIKQYEDFNQQYGITLAKDVLEHIPYEDLEKQLRIFYRNSQKVFIIVPLGSDGKYFIDSYESDKSHFIREDLDWWTKQVENVGYTITESTYDLGPFKKNWQFNEKGNGLIIGEKK